MLNSSRTRPDFETTVVLQRRTSIPYTTPGHPTRGERYDGTQGISPLQRGLVGALLRSASRAMIWLMVFQPVYVAYGMDVATDTTPAPETTGSVETAPVQEHVPESAPAPETTDTTSDTVGAPDDSMQPADEPTPTDTGTTAPDTTDSIDNQNTQPDIASSTDDTEIPPATTGDEAGSSTTNTVSPPPTGTTATETPASSSLPAIPDTVVEQKPSSAFTFNEGDCTLVADGQFYCVRNETPRLERADPRVYAERDRDGDREIYYFDGEEMHQITGNSYDDLAPAFDATSQRIVWQAMINDRMQIMLYDIKEGTTRQITASMDNCSNPDIRGDTVVWQQWVDTNWEIMMTTIPSDGSPFEVTRLTDNGVHDMFPQLYQNLITWQRENGRSWEVVVYDTNLKTETALEKDESTKYENPRFALLFDSKHDNGDVETIGYDLETGKMMELGTRANPQPHAPVSPKDKTPEAIPREVTSTSSVKIQKEDDSSGTS